MNKLKKLSSILDILNLKKEASNILSFAKIKDFEDEDEFYKPLPNFLEIKKSEIEGLGLFTKKKLRPKTELGITHVKDKRFEDGYIRTPLGGFFNHSEDPNCEAYPDGDFVKLRVIKEVLPGKELTAKYWLYNPEEKNQDEKKSTNQSNR